MEPPPSGLLFVHDSVKSDSYILSPQNTFSYTCNYEERTDSTSPPIITKGNQGGDKKMLKYCVVPGIKPGSSASYLFPYDALPLC